jgi:lipopolysaccharide/colanic/teichoic acid biosynthesis glycosyltransferase
MRERLEQDTRLEQRSAYVGSPNSALGDWFALVGEVLIGCMLIGITLPLFVFVALAIKLDSAGPVFRRNPRLGRDGSSFSLLKFRTTTFDPQPIWGRSAGETRVGQLLRYTGIDDLPLVINLARGEMRLFGAEWTPRVLGTPVEAVARSELDVQ